MFGNGVPAGLVVDNTGAALDPPISVGHLSLVLPIGGSEPFTTDPTSRVLDKRMLRETVAALQAVGTPFAAVDILPDPRIREELSAISNWPTIPQLFVNGELVGGCDIMLEMYEDGSLAEMLGAEQPAEEPQPPEASAPESAPLGLENRLGS